MSKQSRRLKHYFDTFIVFIDTKDPRPDLQEIIMNSTNDFVLLSHKASQKGGTKETDVKLIDCHATMSEIAEGVIAKIRIHVHHYAAVYFDLNAFLARLNKELSLKPGSVVRLEAGGKEEPPIEIKKSTIRHRIIKEPVIETLKPSSFLSD